MSTTDKPWGIVDSEPLELREAMVGRTVIDLKEGEEWTEIHLDNRFVIHFRSGAIIVHPDPDLLS